MKVYKCTGAQVRVFPFSVFRFTSGTLIIILAPVHCIHPSMCHVRSDTKIVDSQTFAGRRLSPTHPPTLKMGHLLAVWVVVLAAMLVAGANATCPPINCTVQTRCMTDLSNPQVRRVVFESFSYSGVGEKHCVHLKPVCLLLSRNVAFIEKRPDPHPTLE